MFKHSTSTLMGMTKKELVEYVRIAEYNREVAEETLNQQAENVKDWIPVVRCKACKHCSQNTPDGFRWCDKNELGSIMDDDFCSRGERREGE